MKTLDIKQKLIKKINEMQNDELLEEMVRLIENEDSDNNIYVFSEEQRSTVKESQAQFKNG